MLFRKHVCSILLFCSLAILLVIQITTKTGKMLGYYQKLPICNTVFASARCAICLKVLLFDCAWPVVVVVIIIKCNQTQQFSEFVVDSRCNYVSDLSVRLRCGADDVSSIVVNYALRRRSACAGKTAGQLGLIIISSAAVEHT